MYCRVLNLISNDVSEVRAASIKAMMMEAARTSETSVDIQLRTRQYIPDDSELHTCRHENLKSHITFPYSARHVTETDKTVGDKVILVGL
jgi:hypothetical protein